MTGRNVRWMLALPLLFSASIASAVPPQHLAGYKNMPADPAAELFAAADNTTTQVEFVSFTPSDNKAKDNKAKDNKNEKAKNEKAKNDKQAAEKKAKDEKAKADKAAKVKARAERAQKAKAQ